MTQLRSFLAISHKSSATDEFAVESAGSRFILIVATALGAVFASWASYRIHILGIEEFAIPILDALLQLEGRAPDQYRVLPYLLIRSLNTLLEFIPANTYGLRLPIIVFDALCLTISALLLRAIFPHTIKQSFIWGLFLLYPYLMFDGYRPISAFILLLSLVTMVTIHKARQSQSMGGLWVFVAIVALSFTRADVAFLYAVIFAGMTSARLPVKAAVVATPLMVQILLTRVVFPEAEYFSAVVMIRENLRGAFLLGSPLSYLLVGCALYYHKAIAGFLSAFYKDLPVVCIALAGYLALLCVVAMPNEYRLFLPMLPIVLWRIETLKGMPATAH